MRREGLGEVSEAGGDFGKGQDCHAGNTESDFREMSFAHGGIKEGATLEWAQRVAYIHY
jgi:hypothetical protein